MLKIAAFSTALLLSSLAQTQVSGQPAAKSTTADQSQAAPLWRGLVSGMNASAVALKLQSLPEIKSAEAKIKNGRPPEIKVKYNPSGLKLFGFPMGLAFGFNNSGGLSEVQLASQNVCNDAGYENSLKELAKGLVERYPNKLKVVDENGEESKDQLAFTDGITQVIVRLTAAAPPTEYAVAKAKLDAQLAKAKASYAGAGLTQMLAAMRLERERDSMMRACPSTEGVMSGVALTYASRADSLAQQARSQSEQDEQNREDRNKL